MPPEMMTLVVFGRGVRCLSAIPKPPPVMVAPALLVTVASCACVKPYEAVPEMVPELVTLAEPVTATIPSVPPMMLPPALLVTVASVQAKMPAGGGAGDAAEVGDIDGAGENSGVGARNAGGGIVDHRAVPEKDATSSGDRVARAGGHVDGDAGLDSGSVTVSCPRWCRAAPPP